MLNFINFHIPNNMTPDWLSRNKTQQLMCVKVFEKYHTTRFDGNWKLFIYYNYIVEIYYQILICHLKLSWHLLPRNFITQSSSNTRESEHFFSASTHVIYFKLTVLTRVICSWLSTTRVFEDHKNHPSVRE